MQSRSRTDSEVNTGWFKALRSPEALELIAANKNAFCLLYLIAFRAQRTDRFNRHRLNPGEALIGDCKTIGLTEQEYRTAKAFLKRYEFATFKGTNKGTIATLTDKRIFDINAEPPNGQNNGTVTDAQRTGNGRATTTKKEKKEKKEKTANTTAAGSAGGSRRRGKILSERVGEPGSYLVAVWCRECRRYYPGTMIPALSDDEETKLLNLFAGQPLPDGVTAEAVIEFAVGCWDGIGRDLFSFMGRRPGAGKFPRIPDVNLFCKFYRKFAEAWERKDEIQLFSETYRRQLQNEQRRRAREARANMTPEEEEEFSTPDPADRVAWEKYKREHRFF